MFWQAVRPNKVPANLAAFTFWKPLRRLKQYRVPGLSRGVVFVISMRLAIGTIPVCDKQTARRTDEATNANMTTA